MKKSIYLLFITVTLLLLGSHKSLKAQWQQKLSKITSGKSILTLKDYSKAFDEYWAPYNVQGGYYLKDGVRTKASGWKQFKREQYYWELRSNPTTGEFPTTSSAIEFEKSQFRLNKSVGKTSTANWTNIGTSSSAGGYSGIGRINCVAFHPSDANTYWVGSPCGGIWKTADNGGTWAILNNNMSSLGVGDIAIPSNYVTSNTIYIATGDRVGGSMWTLGTGRNMDNASIGVYKSTNGGTSWSATGLTYLSSAGKQIGRLLLAADNTTLFAGTSDGISKSTDSGATWSSVYNSSNVYVTDMEFKPGFNSGDNTTTIYASTTGAGSSKIIRSTDCGATWNDVFTGAADDIRIELAVTSNDNTYVYAIVSYQGSGGNPLKSILKSTNSGASFSTVWDATTGGATPTGKNLLGYNKNADDLTAGQGSYDLCIAASPSDKNIVIIGGINSWYSTDGGNTWKMKTIWSNNDNTTPPTQIIHADKHFLTFQNGTDVLFECNDGGIYRAPNITSDYVDKTNGLVISQIYRIGVPKSGDVTRVMTGLQDNGSKLYRSGTWTDATGGDGMECIIDYTNTYTDATNSFMYATYTEGQIYRNTDGFTTQTTTTISENIAVGQRGEWVTPYIMNPTVSSTLYAGYDKVWKTTDRGDSWTAISGVLAANPKLSSLAIAPSSADVLYAATRTQIWKTTNATAGTPSWTEITGTLPASSVSLTYIAVKANDPSTVWVTFGGYTASSKVYQSTDGGSNWTNISGTLPNVPVLCIVQSTRSTGSTQLFIGTDTGVYAKDGNNDWILYSDGMPIVPVTELEFYYGADQSSDRLRAATFGRGLWESAVPAALPVEITKFTTVPTKENRVQLDWITATEINNYGFNIERSTGNNDWTKIYFQQGHGNSNSPKFYSYMDNPVGGVKFYYRLKQIDFSGSFKYSDVSEVVIGNPSDFVVHQNFPNPFNPSTTIKYELPIAGLVTIKLFDSIGREVKVLSSKQESAGYHEVIFNGSQFASGVYYYSIQSGDLLQTKKMVLLK